MSYQVLALKYRPQTFDEVVGQPQVTQTLANAIATDRVAHAILLTGPRGTGKTTIARILAKAMNCKTGPTAAPCNTCKICRDITDGNCTDVFEIDGASNNSVEQIRDLRENVAYMPSSAVFKIYIIDEVHMLSTAAFNALLKTLEEPPDHVMFIFATTEVHKIPATILSRCQRHDLGRIPYHMISEHLKTLSDREGFLVDEKSIDLVAREADGSIRDALSLFDRILSASAEKTIEYDHVVHILGALDRKVLVDLCRALIEKDGSRLIEGVEIVHDTGQDLKKFFTDLVQYIRDLNVIRLCGPATSAVNLSDHEKKQLEQMGSRVSPGYINMVLQVLLENETVVRNASHPRTAIEMTLLKLLDIRQDAQIDRIIHHLDTLAKQIEKKVPGIGGSPKRPLPSPRTEPIPNDPPAPPEQKKNWKNFLKEIELDFPFLAALMQKGRVDDTGERRITVELADCSSFDVKRLEDKGNDLKKACENLLGKKLKIVVVSEKNRLKQEQRKKKKQTARQAVYQHPLVVKAKEIFNGEIINI